MYMQHCIIGFVYNNANHAVLTIIQFDIFKGTEQKQKLFLIHDACISTVTNKTLIGNEGEHTILVDIFSPKLQRFTSFSFV